jgi:hypothetical protein
LERASVPGTVLKVVRIKVAGLVVLLVAGVGVAGSVTADEGNPTVCSNGEPPGRDAEASRHQPSMAATRAAQHDLPQGQRAVFNEYTDKFEGVDAVTAAGTYGQVTVAEELVYTCNSDNEPVLAPLSEVDAQAAEEAHRQMSRLLPDRLEANGLGDPAGDASALTGL